MFLWNGNKSNRRQNVGLGIIFCKLTFTKKDVKLTSIISNLLIAIA